MDDFQVEIAASDDPLVVEGEDNLEDRRWDPEGASLLVDLLFKCALRRPPDTAALEAYTAALISGSHTGDMIVAELIDSDEAQRLQGEQIAINLADTIYPAVLGRDPEKTEVDRLVAGLDRASLKKIFSELLASPEALRYQLKMITQRFGIGAILLSEAEARRDLQAERKVIAKRSA